MSGVTNINDLPVNPSIGGNVTMTIADSTMAQQQQQQSSSPSGQVSLDQTTINQIISGLQTASASGATHLPSRDVPINTEDIVKDARILPNYLPPEPQQKYINQNETNEDILYEQQARAKRANTLDELYDEIQIPLLIGVLYFIFQLPAVRKALNIYIPALFNVDGNMNIYGFVFTSTLFGGIYYTLLKTMKFANQ
jgi:hypothetical protein